MNEDASFALPPKLIDTFDRLFLVEMNKLDEQVQHGINAKTREAASRGRLQSGHALHAVVQEIANSIAIRAQIALATSVRCIQSFGLRFDPEVRDCVAAMLKNRIEEQQTRMRLIAQQSPPFHSFAAAPVVNIVLKELDDKTANELVRIDAELDLILAASQKGQEQGHTASPTMIFNAAVGVVQTGTGSNVGIVQQRIDAGASQHLEEAFVKVIEALSKAPETLSLPSTEIQEMVVEAQGELKSPKPNVTKVRALVTGIGSAIEFVPHVKEAYDALKWAATFIGVTLP